MAEPVEDTSEVDPFAMEHPGHVNQGVRDALDKATQCARTVLDLLDAPVPKDVRMLPSASASERLRKREAVEAAEQITERRLVANGMGAVLHLGAALAYAIEDVVLAIYEHTGP